MKLRTIVAATLALALIAPLAGAQPADGRPAWPPSDDTDLNAKLAEEYVKYIWNVQVGGALSEASDEQRAILVPRWQEMVSTAWDHILACEAYVPVLARYRKAPDRALYARVMELFEAGQLRKAAADAAWAAYEQGRAIAAEIAGPHDYTGADITQADPRLQYLAGVSEGVKRRLLTLLGEQLAARALARLARGGNVVVSEAVMWSTRIDLLPRLAHELNSVGMRDAYAAGLSIGEEIGDSLAPMLFDSPA